MRDKPIAVRLASLLVGRAKNARALPLLDGSIKCDDCGKPAVHYDHRDYFKPLHVDPVCCACNFRRGPGKNRNSVLPEHLEKLSIYTDTITGRRSMKYLSNKGKLKA